MEEAPGWDEDKYCFAQQKCEHTPPLSQMATGAVAELFLDAKNHHLAEPSDVVPTSRKRKASSPYVLRLREVSISRSLINAGSRL